ncbi:hypothetical protein COOONC_03828 [Cooperia oncophora]
MAMEEVGKTYSYNTMHDIAIGRRLQVVCVAWTEIAANLLPRGRTTVGQRVSSGLLLQGVVEAKTSPSTIQDDANEILNQLYHLDQR